MEIAIAVVVLMIWIALCTAAVMAALTRLEKLMDQLREEMNAALAELGQAITTVTDLVLATPDANDITQDDINTLRDAAVRLRNFAAQETTPVPVTPVDVEIGESIPDGTVSGVPPYAEPNAGETQSEANQDQATGDGGTDGQTETITKPADSGTLS